MQPCKKIWRGLTNGRKHGSCLLIKTSVRSFITGERTLDMITDYQETVLILFHLVRKRTLELRLMISYQNRCILFGPPRGNQ